MLLRFNLSHCIIWCQLHQAKCALFSGFTSNTSGGHFLQGAHSRKSVEIVLYRTVDVVVFILSNLTIVTSCEVLMQYNYVCCRVYSTSINDMNILIIYYFIIALCYLVRCAVMVSHGSLLFVYVLYISNALEMLALCTQAAPEHMSKVRLLRALSRLKPWELRQPDVLHAIQVSVCGCTAVHSMCHFIELPISPAMSIVLYVSFNSN